MTAEEAKELSKGSMQRKGPFFKARLAWMCGRINQKIEKAAELGEYKIEIHAGKKFAKRYYPVICLLYEQRGFFVAYRTTDSSRTWNEMVISWEDFTDFTKISNYQLYVYLKGDRYEHHTESFEKYYA